MPSLPAKACQQCGKACAREQMKNARCPDCAKAHGVQQYQDRGQTDPFHKKYMGSAWQRLSKSFKAQNPICMFVDHNGQQCRYPAEVVHHRIAAKEREDLFFDPKNLAALCSLHHGHTAGDPAGVKYVPAVFRNSLVPGANLAEPNYSITGAPPRV